VLWDIQGRQAVPLPPANERIDTAVPLGKLCYPSRPMRRAYILATLCGVPACGGGVDVPAKVTVHTVCEAGRQPVGARILVRGELDGFLTYETPSRTISRPREQSLERSITWRLNNSKVLKPMRALIFFPSGPFSTRCCRGENRSKAEARRA
jgi:hypothetical protein